MSYKKDNVKNTLENKVNRAEALAAAWDAVEIVTKKDGSHFVNLGKNFKNCTVANYQYGPEGAKSISVYTYAEGCGYIFDELFNYHWGAPDDMPESRILKNGYTSHYFLTVPEIVAQIKKRVAYYKSVAASCKNALRDFDRIYDTFAAEVTAAFSNVKTACGGDTTLMDLLPDCVQDFYYKARR